MRPLASILALTAAVLLGAQPKLMINELQASNHGTFTTADGQTPDWIEIFNPGTRPVDMLGMRVVKEGRTHEITGPLLVPAKGWQILKFNGVSKSNDEASFKLPGKGGVLLLIDADHVTILDMFSWSDARPGESFGRSPDGASGWSYFATPTPGSSNTIANITARAPMIRADHAPGDHGAPFELSLDADGAGIIYTMDGSAPDAGSGWMYNAPVRIERNAVVRARSSTTGATDGKELAMAFTIGEHGDALHLIVDGDALWNEDHGIDTEGRHTNFSRKGTDWERKAFLQMQGAARPVGLRISGSGSRSLPKRSFKVYARRSLDPSVEGFVFDGHNFSEAMLRADATPNALLRNLLAEAMAKKIGLDVQPSTPLPLYINGNYHGLYRWMPPKDAQWLKTLCGTKELDVLEGPAPAVLNGSDVHYRRGLAHLLSGSVEDSIAAYFDVDNLIDLACIDLFTGRADHDLNVRCYRPATDDGKWRWVLFDMDLWAPWNDNSLDRMGSSLSPEAPFIAQILAHPRLEQRFHARMAELLDTTFSPEWLSQQLDSIATKYEAAIMRDHLYWVERLKHAHPEEEKSEMMEFVRKRGRVVIEQLARYRSTELSTVKHAGQPAPVEISAGSGGHSL